MTVFHSDRVSSRDSSSSRGRTFWNDQSRLLSRADRQTVAVAHAALVDSINADCWTLRIGNDFRLGR